MINKRVLAFLLCLVIGAFVIGAIVGCFYNDRVINFNVTETSFVSVLSNNLKVALFLLFFGGVTGGVLSIVTMYMNGFIVGMTIGQLLMQGYLMEIVRGLLPHLFFELTGLILISVISFFPLYSLLSWIKNKKNNITPMFIFEMCISGVICIFIGAYIESNISDISLI